MERVVPFIADTRGPFEQLLEAEQTAQSIQAWIHKKRDAIRTIKKQAIDHDTPYNDIYGHIKQLEEDIGGFKRLLESNEASRNQWRQLHMTAWRATVRPPLKVVDMPNEILKIFTNFEDDPVPPIQVNKSSFDDPLPSPDVTSIKNIRLTCAVFCDVGSRFLLPVVNVSFTRASLRRLQEISSHPTISKGVRFIQFDISSYSSCLIGLPLFCISASNRLVDLRMFFKNEAVRTQQEKAETLRMSGYRAESRVSTTGGLGVAPHEEAFAIADALQTHSLLGGSLTAMPPGPFETRMTDAILQAHAEYQRRYCEQQSLIQNRQVYTEILYFLRRMPSAQRICITDLHGRHWQRAFMTGWGNRLNAQKYNAMMLGPNPFHELMVQPGAYEHGILASDGEPPLSLLHHLPSMFQAVSQNLTHLDIDIKLHPEIHVGISAEDLESLRNACQQLKALKLRIVKPYPMLASLGVTPECFTMISSLLGAMLGSTRLEELRLSVVLRNAVRHVNSATILGSVLEHISGHGLRGVWLSHIPIKIQELRQLLEKASGELHLEMSDMRLLDGTWAQTLDILRGRTDSTSKIIFPRGGEMTNMTQREARYFRNEFRSEHRDGWYSDRRCPGPASFYIRGGNIPNPLIWG